MSASPQALSGPPSRYRPLLDRAGAADRRGMLRLGAGAGAVLICCGFAGLLDLRRLVEGLPALAQLTREMLPPDFSRARQWARPLLDTFAMSVAGTALAVALSLPLALLAAENTSPHAAVYRATRVLLNLLRAVPELIMGIFFVAAVGFGALPGALALGFHSAGMVGKFFAEGIEHVDPRPVEAARASGASSLQIIRHVILPQALPQLADVVLYRWEYNFRASTVLGVVGAGGIGFELIAALRVLVYDQVLAIMLVILVCVSLVDGLGASVRRRLR
jgi:phosphonate transport system permease protein